MRVNVIKTAVLFGGEEKTACLGGGVSVFRNVPSSKKEKEILFVITGLSILKNLKEQNSRPNYFSTKAPRENRPI
jgi:hypothetical protein